MCAFEVSTGTKIIDLELLYVRIFKEFCDYTAPAIVLRFTRRRHYANAVAR